MYGISLYDGRNNLRRLNSNLCRNLVVVPVGVYGLPESDLCDGLRGQILAVY